MAVVWNICIQLRVFFVFNRIAWTLTYVALIVVTTTLVVLLALVTRLYTQSNFFILWLILFLYGMAAITAAFMFAILFSKAQSAGSVAAVAIVSWGG